MKDLFFKLKILYYLLFDVYTQWKKGVWGKELDSNYCCNGRECCCGGMSIRDVWTPSSMTNKAAGG